MTSFSLLLQVDSLALLSVLLSSLINIGSGFYSARNCVVQSLCNLIPLSNLVPCIHANSDSDILILAVKFLYILAFNVVSNIN